MKGKIHQILNDRIVMKEIELIIELPAGSLKYYIIRKGDMIQVTKPVTKERRARKKKKESHKDLGEL